MWCCCSYILCPPQTAQIVGKNSKMKKVINKIKCYLFLCITQRDKLIGHLVLEKSKIYIASIFINIG